MVDLRHHGDAEVAPGLLDLAVNVRGTAPPDWLRAELVGETLRAALNELAEVDPGWLRGFAQPEWFERYSHRVEEYRLPKSKAARDAYLLTVGRDGSALLDALDEEASDALTGLGRV